MYTPQSRSSSAISLALGLIETVGAVGLLVGVGGLLLSTGRLVVRLKMFIMVLAHGIVGQRWATLRSSLPEQLRFLVINRTRRTALDISEFYSNAPTHEHT
jgi:hypothetical protein